MARKPPPRGQISPHNDQHQYQHQHQHHHQQYASSLPTFNHQHGGGNHQYGGGNQQHGGGNHSHSSLPIFNHQHGGGNHQYGSGNHSQQRSSNRHNHRRATTSRIIPNHKPTTHEEDLLEEGRGLVDDDTGKILDDMTHQKVERAAYQREYRLRQKVDREKQEADANSNNLVLGMHQAVLAKNREVTQDVIHGNNAITSKLLGTALENNANENNGGTKARSSNYADGQIIDHTDHDDKNRPEKGEDATNKVERRPRNEDNDQNQTNYPNNNQGKDSSASDRRYPSLIPHLNFPSAKQLSENKIIYSISLPNKASNENVDPNMDPNVSLSTEVHPIRVDMCQRENLMTMFNLYVQDKFPNHVVPRGVDEAECIKDFAALYKTALHNFFHGNGDFDFTEQEKCVALKHTFSIVDSYISPTGEEAYKNSQIKTALRYSSGYSHLARKNLSKNNRGKGGTPQRGGCGFSPSPSPRRSSYGHTTSNRGRSTTRASPRSSSNDNNNNRRKRQRVPTNSSNRSSSTSSSTSSPASQSSSPTTTTTDETPCTRPPRRLKTKSTRETDKIFQFHSRKSPAALALENAMEHERCRQMIEQWHQNQIAVFEERHQHQIALFERTQCHIPFFEPTCDATPRRRPVLDGKRIIIK